jgi:hypothetical protein
LSGSTLTGVEAPKEVHVFGQWYAQRDTERAEGQWSKEGYVSELLAEVLNRARLLEPLYVRCIEAHRDPGERGKALEDLAAGVEVFLEDVHEARERGARINCYAVTTFGVLDIWIEGDGDLMPKEG